MFLEATGLVLIFTIGFVPFVMVLLSKFFSLNDCLSDKIPPPGKALISNTLGLSKLVHLAKVLILPHWAFTPVNALIWLFIWGCTDGNSHVSR